MFGLELDRFPNKLLCLISLSHQKMLRNWKNHISIKFTQMISKQLCFPRMRNIAIQMYVSITLNCGGLMVQENLIYMISWLLLFRQNPIPKWIRKKFLMVFVLWRWIRVIRNFRLKSMDIQFTARELTMYLQICSILACKIQYTILLTQLKLYQILQWTRISTCYEFGEEVSTNLINFQSWHLERV